MAASVQIKLLGEIAIVSGNQVLSGQRLRGRQPRLALGLLVLERYRPVSRDELAEVLWPEALPGSWQIALRGVISHVRQFLAAGGCDGPDLLATRNGCYQLSLPAHVSVDVEAAEADATIAAAALGGGDYAVAASRARTACTLAGLPLMAGVEGAWLDRRRRSLGRVHAKALETLALASLATADPATAVRAAEQIVDLDPLAEGGYRLLITAHHAAGEHARAAHAYERCRQVLVAELGVGPSPETQVAAQSFGLGPGRKQPPRRPAGQAADLTAQGRRALERGQHEAAIRHYRQALAGLSGEHGGVAHAEALILLGAALKQAGQAVESDTALMEAASIARENGATTLLAEAAVVMAGHDPVRSRARPAVSALVSEALVQLDDQPSALRARLLSLRAEQLSTDSRVDEAQTTGRLAIAMATAAGDAEVLADAVTTHLRTLTAPIQAGERLAAAGDALGRIGPKGPAALRTLALESSVHALVELGEWPAATATMDRFASEADHSGVPHLRWIARQHQICRTVVAGRLDELDTLVRESVVLGQLTQDERVASAAGIMHLVVPRWLQGRLQELRRPMEDIWAWLDWPPRSRAAAAFYAAERGDRRVALRHLGKVCKQLDRLPVDAEWTSTMFYLVSASTMAHSAVHAEQLYGPVVSLLGRHCTFRGLTYYGSYSHLAGRLATAMGRWNEACIHFESALVEHDRAGARPWVVLTRQDLADALRERDGRRAAGRADQLEATAEAEAATIGMSLVAGRAAPALAARL
jgi:DNA-binding SARP family transcriptional activator